MPFNRKYMDDPIFLVLDRVLVGDDCWEWTGPLDNHGYAKAGVYNKDIKVHRFVYEHFIGPIPEGLVLDHLCFNKKCVRPAHLEPVTQRVNVQRHFARQTHCRHGHLFDEANTYIHSGRRKCRTCHRINERERKRAAKAS